MLRGGHLTVVFLARRATSAVRYEAAVLVAALNGWL